MSELLQLEPQPIWKNFSALNAVPRPSKKEEKVRQFIIDFGNNLGLNVETDEVGNVLIKKAAYPGMEDRKTIVMQSHLDMVCQKNNDVDFDFDTQGIDMYVDGDFVTARGTTLGADNGIGVATIMAILESKTIPHPAVEAFFTIDEETGMTGALGLKAGFLSGKILLNLDTEEDDELDIGCAGGVDVTATRTYTLEALSEAETIQLTIKGLQGGHSGIQIHQGLGNANKLIARFLNKGLDFAIRLVDMKSGGLRNAIPREGGVSFAVASTKKQALMEALTALKSEIIEEFITLEPNITIDLTDVDTSTTAMSVEETQKVVKALLVAHNGVYRMSPDVEGLVETSNNVAKVTIGEGAIKVLCLTRSSIDSGKEALAQTLKAAFELGGFDVSFSGAYPGWKANPESEILDIMKALYEEKFGEEPKVVACHAGLECGIIGTNYPGLDMISFGPNIYGAHSPDERVEIKSVQKFWNYLLATLERIPVDGAVDYSCENTKNA